MVSLLFLLYKNCNFFYVLRVTLYDGHFSDDWMGNVENAIAMALKKDGVEPPEPKLQIRSSNDNGKTTTEPEHQSSKGKKRKRRRLEKDIARKEELKKVNNN